MVKKSYVVNALTYKDGTIVVTSDEIEGLVMEVNSRDELNEELMYLGKILLMANHGLTEDDLLNVQYIVNMKETRNNRSNKPNGPHVYIQEHPRRLVAAA